ncbi:DTL protein, partial [Amia calva]|nr:DTL protein [Amia calva]
MHRFRLGLGSRYPLSSLIDCFQCARQDEHISYGDMGIAVPPFGCTFSSAQGLQQVLAVANEEGIVRLYNTESRSSPILKEWMAHANAVFDIAWVPGEHCLVTASGDQMAKLWDVKTGQLMGTFKGHQCSLKSVAFAKQEKAVFCTGGRDGNIMVWDTRCSKKDGFYRQVKQICGAHNKPDRQTPSKLKKKRQSSRGIAPTVDSQQSVTVVLFRDENTLISSGAVDGVIKMWDLRKNYTAHNQDPVPLQAYPYPGNSIRKLGYSGLTLDSTGSSLFANCTDENIYKFNVTGLKTAPVSIFNGHLNSSFYITSSVSPDDQFLVSGSSDHNAYIWKISDPKRPPIMLQGHCQEVTSIAWCPTDFTKIASCSDDNTVRIWRLNRGAEGEKSSLGASNVVGRACPKLSSHTKLPEPMSPSESTPAKMSRVQCLGALSSPQAAACAPAGADLPLPSSTPSFSLQTPPSKKRCSVTPRRTASSPSIRQWMTRSPNSPSPSTKAQGTPTPRKVLSPSGQSPALASERRVKRRLESSSEGVQGCPGDCDCVTELYPAAKRRPGLGGVCCPAKDTDERCGEEAETCCLSGEQNPTSLKHPDKENSSPQPADWLSAMGQTLKGERGSPSSFRSPSSTKRQEGRTSASPVHMFLICLKAHPPTPILCSRCHFII